VSILAFDTATRATAVALCEPGGFSLQARDDPPPGNRPNHATTLLPLIAELLDRADGGWHGIERIAVGVGPGTFTGLRIGVATARALGRAREIRLVAISTLQSLAVGAESQAKTTGTGLVLAVLDARRGEVFAAGWRDALGDQAVISPCACAPEALAAMIGELGARVLAVGDGAVEFRSVLERSGALIPEDESELHRVSAVNHCRLARTPRAAAHDQVRPEYIRLPDAELSRRAATRQ
jgi:tRNA threonylcarbamoyladenosine biosynthesis protein TsaB